MATVDIDVSEVVRLATDLAAGSERLPAEVKPVMARAGFNMKAQGRREAAGIQGGRIAAAWSYETRSAATSISVLAGPREGGAGSLAFFYYGNSKIGPRLPDPVGLLESEAERTVEQLGLAAQRAFR